MAEDEKAGLPVAGYRRTQPPEKIAAVNENKILEERCLRAVESAARQFYVDNAENETEIAQALTEAEINFRAGFMWLNRAIFQPGRIALPEEEQANA